MTGFIHLLKVLWEERTPIGTTVYLCIRLVPTCMLFTGFFTPDKQVFANPVC